MLQIYDKFTNYTNYRVTKCFSSYAKNLLSGHAWNETGMELYLAALERGELLGFKGASGPVQFDSECYTAALNTTYVNWIISDGHLYHQSYYSTQGNAQTSQTLAS